MSRFVKWAGKFHERFLLDPLLDPAPGTCPRCGGAGVVAESIDDERCDVAVPCPHCRMWCKQCRNWVKRAGHQCEAR